MTGKTFFITGTDTGAGKTVLTAILARFLREQGANAAALKPVCSGGRDDVRALHAAMNGLLALDEINPWHFCAPIAPLTAARREKKCVKLPQVVAHVRVMQKRFDVLLVEGAGGLLSPLGEDFDSRDLIVVLRAMPVVVCPNRLGAVNQVLLTLEALPKTFQARAVVILVSPSTQDIASKTNAKLLAQFFDPEKILLLPWISGRGRFDPGQALKYPRVRRMLRSLTQDLSPAPKPGLNK